MTQSFVVYMLVDPRSYRPYYVGQTRDRVKRLRFHFAASDGDTALEQRNRAIIQAGSVPLMIVLEDASSRTEALIKELFWIELFTGRGISLCNRESRIRTYRRFQRAISRTTRQHAALESNTAADSTDKPAG